MNGLIATESSPHKSDMHTSKSSFAVVCQPFHSMGTFYLIDIKVISTLELCYSCCIFHLKDFENFNFCFFQHSCRLQQVKRLTHQSLFLTVKPQGSDLSSHDSTHSWHSLDSISLTKVRPPLQATAGLYGYAQHTDVHFYIGPYKLPKNTLTHTHTCRVILGYWYLLTKSPQTNFMCRKFDTKQRRG